MTKTVVESIKSVLLAFLLSFLGITVAALLFTYTSLKDQYQVMVVFGIMALSIFYAGFMSAKQAAKKGWLHGGAIGLMYICMIAIVASLISKSVSMDATLSLMAVLAIGAGMIGGIFGVNAKN